MTVPSADPCVFFFGNSGNKKRAPRAIRDIRSLATKTMKTKDVRIDTTLNKYVWGNGIKNVPRRVRVRMERKRNENEDAKEAFYTLCSAVEVPDFKGLLTTALSE